ncbi:MAG: integrin alpha, partial [Limisphaerales bacterium]
ADTGSVFIYSGADGSLLFEKNGNTGDFLGSAVAGAGDVNGDGRADFMAGAPLSDPNGINNAGSVFVYSGADGSLLFRVDGLVAEGRLGWKVAGIGNVNFDGNADVIIAAPFSEPEDPLNYDAGSVFVYSYSSPAQGDMNADGNLTLSDVVMLLNCIFLGTGNCYLSVSDLNCDALLTPVDVVLELNAVFLGIPINCTP